MANDQRALRTPLGRVRGLGSARHGTEAWWGLRLSSLALVPLSLWFVVSVLSLVGASRADMGLWLQNPLAATLMVVTLAVTFHHGAAGVREILEDYVHEKMVRTLAIIAVNFLSVVIGGWAIVSVLVLAFGG